MKLLKSGHYDVKLELAQWRALAAWIDCNAPYYGDWDEIMIHATGNPNTLPRIQRQPTAAAKKQIQERKAKLQQQENLVAYLDCGVQLKSGGSGVTIQQTRGKPYNYCPADQVQGLISTQADIAFDNTLLTFEIKGLNPDKNHKLELTWWDYNAAGRKQSVWLSRANGKRTRLLPTTQLPDYDKEKKLPEQISLDLPAGEKEITISIQRDGQANVVLSEIWITQ